MEQVMEYIYTVYKEGSISKAAEKLFITQPALSMAIRKLETELNATLFDRSQHPLKLTNVGEIYIQKYYEIKVLEKELASQINDIHELQKGELTIGGTHYILSYVLAPVLSAFSRQYPNIAIRLYECSSDQLDGLLLNGKIDLCLKCDSNGSAFTPIDFAFRDYLLIAVPRSYVVKYDLPNNGLSLDMVKKDVHLSARCPCVNLQAIGNLPYLVLTKGNNLNKRFHDLFDEHALQPIIQMYLDQVVTAYHLADYGMGATLTSSIIIKKSNNNNLMYYKVNSPIMTRDFYVIGRHKRYIPTTNSKFIEMLKLYYA